MRVTAKGRATLPKPLRDAAGMPPGSEVTVTLDGGRIVIAKAFTAVKVDRRAELRAAAAKVRASMGARFRRLGADEIVAFLRPDDERRDRLEWRARSMRITVTLDDELLAQAGEAVGVAERSVVLHEGLKLTAQREAAKRLVLLGGSDPTASAPPRRRPRPAPAQPQPNRRAAK